MISALRSGQQSFQKEPTELAFHGELLLSNNFALNSVVREGQMPDSVVHSHDVGQLIYPEKGAILLETPEIVVRLAPDRAAWIPSGLAHSVLGGRNFRYHSLYIDRSFNPFDSFGIRKVTPLLRALILDASTWEGGHLDFGRRYRKTFVIIDELMRAPLSSSGTQVPEDRRIAGICRELEGEPSIGTSIATWAREVGASEKTIQRAFVSSTGQTFQQWRHQLRMTRALELHGQGLRLIDIALSVGYETERAYARAFKNFYGHPPSRLRSGKQ